MTAQTSIPYDWLRHIPHSLLEKDEVPILSSPGPFPLEAFTTFLAKTFQLEKFEIALTQWENHTSDSVLKGIGSPVKCVHLELSPVQGHIIWAMAEKDINVLMSLILSKDPRASDIIDKEYRDGFFDFLAMEVLLAFNRCEYDKGLTPHILENNSLPEGAGLCTDVSINCNGVSFLGRLILSEEFRHSWKERYTQRKMTLDMSPELANKLQVIVHLEAGHTNMTQAEWKSTAPGDYIILDHCSLEPDSDKGRVLITMNGLKLFRAKVKQGNIKILEFPLYNEVDTVMSNEEDDEDMDEYFDESEIEEHDETEFHDEDEEEFESEEPSIEGKTTPPPAAKEPPSKPAQAASASPAPVTQQQAVSPDNINMTVVVEVGRLQISIQKLLELQPGNLLELDVHPENGVDLVVNGTCIGRGELLRIGDTLGVRILDKG